MGMVIQAAGYHLQRLVVKFCAKRKSRPGRGQTPSSSFRVSSRAALIDIPKCVRHYEINQHAAGGTSPWNWSTAAEH